MQVNASSCAGTTPFRGGGLHPARSASPAALARFERAPARSRLRSSALAIALSLASLPALARTLTDDTGAAVTVPDVPARVVALAPDLTEIAFQLGAGDALVGACGPCDSPAAAAALPKVGPMIEPSIEAILLLRPDLVLATAEGNPLASVERLRSLGVPVFGVRPGPGIEGIARELRVLGDVLGRREHGEELASRVSASVRAVRERNAGAPRLRACILAWTDPLVAAGTDAYLTDLLDAAGADNACATSTGWPQISRETLLVLRPRLLLLATGEEEAGLGAWAASLPAVRDGAVVRLPTHPFLRPSADLARAADEMDALVRGARARLAAAPP